MPRVSLLQGNFQVFGYVTQPLIESFVDKMVTPGSFLDDGGFLQSNVAGEP